MSCNNPIPSIRTLGPPVTQDAIAEPPRVFRIPHWSLQTGTRQLEAQTQSDAEKHIDTALIDIFSGDVNGSLFRYQEERDRRPQVGKTVSFVTWFGKGLLIIVEQGTLSFIPRCTLEGTDVRHCPIHDLESTIYLIFWVGAYIVKRKTYKRRLHTKMLILIIKHLRSDSSNLRVCAMYKKILLDVWSFSPVGVAKGRLFGAFAPFAEILCELAKLERKWDGKSLEHKDNSTMFTHYEIEQAFKDYLEVYDKYLPAEESWDYLQRLRFRDRMLHSE